jgi:glycosyltransferase involved in cell wall biosynthesis
VKVSIITVVFNNHEFIEDCIKSILNQTYSNIEYIVIDGGSTDGTLDVINQYKNKIAKVISEPLIKASTMQ